MSALIHVSDTLLSDHSKEAFGCRYRGYKEWWTQEELDAEHDRLAEICEQNDREESALALLNQRDFETRINTVIECGAGNRETALNWMFGHNIGHEFGEDYQVTSELYDLGIFGQWIDVYRIEIVSAIS